MATSAAVASFPTPAEHHLTAFYPHFLTLTALIYLLGPSAASITLILSITLITGCLILRPQAFPPSHSAAVVAAASSDMRTTQEVRAFYYGYIKGFEDGKRDGDTGVAVAAAVDDVDDVDARSERTVGTTATRPKSARGGICGPAVMWKDRPAFSASTGSSRPASVLG
ncbi:hypothetical protein BZA05DRAFT_383728 [Tricharina praecox]|uniref:uncharacterized protein n=1 Tax=Tricharina praecox TaxID=43433 RepID=UPI00221E9EB7|nr:uncharacterized protein BZA05DRAFT_383728 [Tricharina praecox]KAI5859230.1 hypothetical protein BZA05DRAFT_383728 [Tricharina praecox]